MESELLAIKANPTDASIRALTASEHCPQIKEYSFVRLRSRISSCLEIPSILFYHLHCSATDAPAGRSAGNAKKGLLCENCIPVIWSIMIFSANIVSDLLCISNVLPACLPACNWDSHIHSPWVSLRGLKNVLCREHAFEVAPTGITVAWGCDRHNGLLVFTHIYK